MFTKGFDNYACVGDTIECDADGFRIVARIEYDHDAGPPDTMQDGFWPSLDPKDAGYIGPRTKRTLQRHMDHARRVMDAWRNDEWFYCGVVLSISRNGIELDRYAASLWGIECNWPRRNGSCDNGYLLTVANELLGEALDCACAKLAQLCGRDWIRLTGK